MVTTAQFLADPDASRVILAEITVKRIEPTADWTQEAAPNDDTYYEPWPWHPVRPSAVGEWDGSNLTDMGAEVANLAACQAADGSWWYDDTNERVYINPTGAIGTNDYVVSRIIRVATTDIAHSVSSRMEHYHGSIIKAPIFKRSLSFLRGNIQPAAGTLHLQDTTGLDLATSFNDEIWMGGAITLKLGGSSKGEDLSYANYQTLFTGVVASGQGTIGTIERDRITDAYIIPFSDNAALFSATVPATATPYSGRLDQIITSVFSDAGLTAPTIATDVSTDRDEHCAFVVPNAVPVVDVLNKAAEHLLVTYVNRAGTVTVDQWVLPDSGVSSPTTFDESYDPSFPEGLRVSLDYSKWFNSVRVFMGAGKQGLNTVNRNLESRVENSEERFEEGTDSFTTGWTRVGSTNVWRRAYGRDVDEVHETQGGTHRILEKETSFNACDTNNLSWFYGQDASVSSGNPFYLHINPNASPGNPNTGTTIEVHYRIEKNRSSESVAGANDENLKTSSDGDADFMSAIIGKTKVLDLRSLVTNDTHAQDLANDMVAFHAQPFEFWKFNANTANATNVELNDTIKVNLADSTSIYLRVLSITEDHNRGRVDITAWKAHDGSAIT